MTVLLDNCVCAATDRPGRDSIGKLDKGEKKTMLVRSLFAAAQSTPRNLFQSWMNVYGTLTKF